ncbi:hypothetical protein [Staphylococcus equorum]|uniref:hypothetical protein n=1 Tax=Staphylococcus equorum TaxID=246432 RepID=UPI003CEDC716
MQILLNYKKTTVFLVAIIFLISSLLMFLSPSADAQEETKDNAEQLNEKELNEEGQFIENEALKIDENGQPVGIDLNKVEERHGYIPQEAKDADVALEEKVTKKGEVEKEVGSGYRDSNDCLYSELTKTLKASLPTTVINSVIDYANSGQYGKAIKKLGSAGFKGSGIGTVYTVVSIDAECTYKYGLLNS